LKGKEKVTDNYCSGLEEANIKYDPVEMPIDTELLDSLTNKKVAELGRTILDLLQNLQTQYFKSGENHLRRKEYEQAIESFYNAIFDEKIKGLHTPITDKACQYIDEVVDIIESQ